MHPEHIKQLPSVIKGFHELNIDNRIAEAYKNQPDLSLVKIVHFTVIEFVEFSKKAITIIEDLLNSKLITVLPTNYNFQNDFGAGDLLTDIDQYNTAFLTNNFDAAFYNLQRIIYYLVQNGLWEKEPEKSKTKKIEIISEIESKLNLLSEKLNKNIDDNAKLLSDLNSEKVGLVNFINAKNQELNEITSLIVSARKNSDEITRLLNTGTENNQKINSILEQQNTKLEETKKRLLEEIAVYNALENNFKRLQNLYETEIGITQNKNTDFDTLLKSVTDNSSTFEARLNVLNELIGKEGAVKLFSTFNDRKKDFQAIVKRWFRTVIGTGIVAFALVICLFTNFFGLVGGVPVIGWEYLLINSLKSVPIMVVLYFTIRQYVKERSYEEEYAFRSAIALTVQAYGDIAGAKKEELIFKAVESIYTMPVMMKERSGLFSFRTKNINETLKQLNETIKGIKDSTN
jgi:hypothetical protein